MLWACGPWLSRRLSCALKAIRGACRGYHIPIVELLYPTKDSAEAVIAVPVDLGGYEFASRSAYFRLNASLILVDIVGSGASVYGSNFLVLSGVRKTVLYSV